MKNKLITLIILVLILGAGYFFFKGFTKSSNPVQQPTPSQTPAPIDDSSARVVKTVPDPLDETIIPADQVIEITFNKPLQNIPEFKVKFEPKVDFKVELSSDRKTAKITHAKPFELGGSYTLSITPDTKFDGVGNWGQDKSFRFRTVKYRGI